MDAYQKHLSQSRCRASPELLLFQALTKHTQCNSITHTGPAHGSNQARQWVPPRSSAGINSCATNGDFQEQCSSRQKTFALRVGTCWGVIDECRRVMGVVWEVFPLLKSQFKSTIHVQTTAYRVGRAHIPVLASVFFYQHAHSMQSKKFFKGRTLSPLCLSLSFPPLKILFFLHKWFSHTANINI